MAKALDIGRQIKSMNPATGEELRIFTSTSDSEVNDAVARGRLAQPAWSACDIRERLGIVRKFRRVLHENKSSVARLITQEAGKPYVEALLTEVMVVLDAARFLIDSSYSLFRDETVLHGNWAMKTKRGYLRREPYGVVGIISPWNYPFSIPATETLAALVAGNCVVLKPSEFTTLVAMELSSLLYWSGVPQDVFQVLPGDGKTGKALTDAALDKLIFTGSVSTGRRVAEAAAARLLPVVLELGGKDPMLVLDDADIDVASSGAVWGAFVNAGQACLSVERCYAHRSLYSAFLDACVRKVRELKIGNGINPDTDIGPMIHAHQLHLVESHVDDARQHGAQILCGGKRLSELGPNFYAPTILSEVTHAMRIMREETFGPVLPIMPFDSDEEAIQRANDSEFGLAASIWTRDQKRGENLARRIQAGTVMINDLVSCFGISEAPHGGVKASGIGHTHGRFGLEEMVRVKYVDCDRTANMKKVWWYGYGETFLRQMEGFLDLLFAPSIWQRLRGGIRATGAIFRKKS